MKSHKCVFVEASGSSPNVPSIPFVFAFIPSTICYIQLLWSNDGLDILIQLLKIFHLLLDFDFSLKHDLAIPLHVDDYDVPFAIIVFEFQFPSIVDHSPSPDFDVGVIDFEASHDAIDYDFPFGDFKAQF
jgi:hypothetical protein